MYSKICFTASKSGILISTIQNVSSSSLSTSFSLGLANLHGKGALGTLEFKEIGGLNLTPFIDLRGGPPLAMGLGGWDPYQVALCQAQKVV